jgi:glycerate 2-kinase
MEKTLRRQAISIFRAALKAAGPEEAVRRHFHQSGGVLVAGTRKYPLKRFRRVFVVGAGKAGSSMARAVESVLGSRISGGLVNVKYGHVATLRRIELNQCGHPVPDEAGVAGARRIAEICAGAEAGDLIVCVISGGASALMPSPTPPVTLAEKQQTTRLLLACGANIHEINAVRKHISSVKGGQLARLASPATVIALMLSDVIGDDLDVIGSGPTAPDGSTFGRALEILDKYRITGQAPAAVMERLRAGAGGRIEETPKPGDAAFEKVQNLVVGSNKLAVDAAAVEAKRLGLKPVVLSTLIEGETREIAKMHAAIAREALASGRPAKPPVCFISGGETTVTLAGDGLGGRNMEFVLAAAIDLDGMGNVVVLSGGTDGTDGPTDAAGAIADGASVSRAAALGMDARKFLSANDSYRFFEPLNDLLKTGPTNTNVMDVRLFLISPGIPRGFRRKPD